MRYKTRFLLMVTVTLGSLLLVTLAGGAALGLAEGITYLEGLWLAYSVVSTTGFGEAPQTLLGTLLAMLLFVLGVLHWIGILVAAFEFAFARMYLTYLLDDAFEPPLRQNGRRTANRSLKQFGPRRPAGGKQGAKRPWPGQRPG